METRLCKVNVVAAFGKAAARNYGFSTEQPVPALYFEFSGYTFVIMLRKEQLKRNLEKGNSIDSGCVLTINYSPDYVTFVDTDDRELEEMAFLYKSEELYPPNKRLDYSDLNLNPEKYTVDQLLEPTVLCHMALEALEEKKGGKQLVNNNGKPGSNNTESVTEHIVISEPTMESDVKIPSPEFREQINQVVYTDWAKTKFSNPSFRPLKEKSEKHSDTAEQLLQELQNIARAKESPTVSGEPVPFDL